MIKGIISNTGPLIALAGINRLDILKALFDTVIVPTVVHQEILEGGRFLTGLDEYRKTNWLQITDSKRSVDPLLTTFLDAGEASVILLAQELDMPVILMDERKGRRVAREVYGLKVMGTARLLVEAKKARLITSTKEALQEMRNAGYWIHDNLIKAILKESGEE